MKQSDWAAVILVAGLSLIFSYVLGANFLSPSDNRVAEIEEVIAVQDNFPQPDPEIFNKDAINIAELIEIDESNNKAPF